MDKTVSRKQAGTPMGTRTAQKISSGWEQNKTRPGASASAEIRTKNKQKAPKQVQTVAAKIQDVEPFAFGSVSRDQKKNHETWRPAMTPDQKEFMDLLNASGDNNSETSADSSSDSVRFHPGFGNSDTRTGSDKHTSKKCNLCGELGHVKRNCRKNKKGNGGGKSSADAALKSAMADFAAQNRAAEDVKKEHEKDERKEKPPAEDSDDIKAPDFSFKVPHRITANLNWVRFKLFVVLFPFFLLFFTIEVVLMPKPFTTLFSILFGKIMSGNLVWYILGTLTLDVLVLGVSETLIQNFFEMLSTHIYGVHEVFLYSSLPPTVHYSDDLIRDKRPIDSTFGKRQYSMSLGEMEIVEKYYLNFPFWNLLIKFGEETVATGLVVSKSAIALYGANISSYRSLDESSDFIRRNLSKCSKINWDCEVMVSHEVLENTALYLDYLKMIVDIKAYDFNNIYRTICSDGLFCRPWWFKNKFALFVVMSCFLFIGALTPMWAGLASAIGNTFYSMFLFLRTSAFLEFPIANAEPVSGVFGYRVTDPSFSDVDINPVSPTKNLVFTQLANIGVTLRGVMATLSPLMISGMSMPIADRNHLETTMAGLIHRGAALTPTPIKEWMNRKREIAKEMLETRCSPLTDGDLLKFEEMVENTSYTLDRKREIIRWHKNRIEDFHRPTRNRTTGMFNKEEPYAEYKHIRSIHAMHRKLLESDIWGSVGRLVHTIQKTIYDSFEPSVKHLTPDAIAAKLLSLGPGTKTVSDYSSYEASFTSYVKSTAQMPMYQFFTQSLSGYSKRVYKHVGWTVNSLNEVKNKFFTAEISDLKCSGDFDTALSNWFDNVVTWATVFDKKHGIHWSDSINWFLCEGDDNITDDHGYPVDKDDFANLGMKAKISNNLVLEEAGFCQKYVTSNGTLIGDVVTFLGKRQYLPAKYHLSNETTLLSLCRATAMSTLSQYPNAPGISEWAWRVLELTSTITVKQSHLYEAQRKGGGQLVLKTSFTKPNIRYEDRVAVSSVFGFSLRQQAILTESLERWVGGPLSLPLEWFPDLWRDFYVSYNSSRSPLPEAVWDTKTLDSLRPWLDAALLATRSR